MAPTPTGSKNKKPANSKGKQMKSKVPEGSAKPVVRQKRLVNCSKCKSPHFPPTGRACQKQVNMPNPDLSSTLANAEEQSLTGSPTLSPVRPDPATLAALETLAAQRQALAQGSPTPSLVGQASPRLEPNTQETEAQMIQNLLYRFGQNAQSATTHAPPVGQPPIVGQPILNPTNRPGPSTQSDNIHISIPPHNPNAQMQDMLERILKNQLNMRGDVNDLIEKERLRGAHVTIGHTC